jgi:hypothetical protein
VANNNNNNRPNNQQRKATTAPAPTPAPTEDKVVTANPVVQEQDGVVEGQMPPGNPETVPTEAPAAYPVDAAAATVAAETTTEETVAESEDDKLVADLKVLLAEFAEANVKPGTKPEDFVESAKKASAIVRYVTRFPNATVLGALLDFFKENINGVCSGSQFLKGSTMLQHAEEQKLGFLYNLFETMAQGHIVRYESAAILRVLGKSEFVTFYNRQQNVLKQG